MTEQQPPKPPAPKQIDDDTEMVIYRALKMITAHIEQKRKLGQHALPEKPKKSG